MNSLSTEKMFLKIEYINYMGHIEINYNRETKAMPNRKEEKKLI